MRFTCFAPTFLDGLSVATRALSARTTQPILEGVLLAAAEDRLTLTCSDGEISIVTAVAAEVAEEGSIVLPGKLLLDVARKMPQTENVSVETKSDTSVTLRCLGVRITLAGQNSVEFPALPLISAKNTVYIKQAELRDMISQTSFSVAVNDNREVLNGCLLEVRGSEVNMVALDGFRMAIRKGEARDDDVTVNAIIHGRALGEIGKIVSDSKDDDAMLLIGGSQMVLNMGDTQLYTKLIAGEYINYRQILPATFKTRARVSREALAMGVDRASLMAREGKSSLLRMSIDTELLVITANSASGEAYEEVPIQMEGDPLDIAFNVRYISDVMRALDDEEVELRFNSPVSPCLIVPTEGDRFCYLVLPVRVGL